MGYEAMEEFDLSWLVVLCVTYVLCVMFTYVATDNVSSVSCVSQAPEIHRGALWILGEYANSVEDISRVMQVVKSAIGEVSTALMHTHTHQIAPLPTP